MLLVDDQYFNLIPLKGIIEVAYAKKCDEAVNGLLAVDMYYRNMTKTCCEIRYRVIFTDIQMPEMDGITELKQIKHHEKNLRSKNPALNEIVIVMVSAFDELDVIQKCFDLGAKDYFIKPVSAQKVKNICNTMFSKVRQKQTKKPSSRYNQFAIDN